MSLQNIDFDDEKLVMLLKNKIPEIEDYLFIEFEFSVYIAYGTLGTFMRDKINELSNNNDLLDVIVRSFTFLNFLVENGDNRVIQMLRVETFEVLTDSDAVLNFSLLL